MDFTHLWERLEAGPLFLDQAKVRLAIDQDQVEKFYLPLARHIIDEAGARSRYLVGLSGPPGSGKSAFAGLLSAVIQIITEKPVAVVSMDGWHFSGAYLDSHSLEQQGHRVLLRQLKGAPETFDFESFLVCVTAIRHGEEVLFPCYDRHLHDPQPEAGKVSRENQIVITEGNYLLLDEEPWRKLRSLFDLTIFIQVDLAGLETGLLERHLRGGREIEDAHRHIQHVDMANARRILAGFPGADVIIHKLDACRIAAVETQPGPGRP